MVVLVVYRIFDFEDKMEFSKLQLTSFVFVCLATIFLIVGVSTNYWLQTVDSEEVLQSSIGLWKSCTYDAKGTASCVSLSSIKNTGNGVFMEWAGWIYAQKTFAFIAIILSFVSVCAFVVFRFSGGKCARVIQAGLVMATLTSFLAFGMFVVHMPTNPPSVVHGYSFILFTTGSVLIFVATCISMRQICLPEKAIKNSIPRKV